ncbi:MAG TPA: amidohydrolase family protein [Candidatus Limnocylindrales bacterium]|nr:amidohydrolase family protein [Candidatus Limnocylindrales bacterium]
MAVDLLVTGGTVVLPDGTRRASIAVERGRIVAIASETDELPEARERIDATGLHVLPGVIDTHTHARDPSVDAREDFGSATAAAAAGGITTILEMPISTPSVHSTATFERRVEIVQPKAHVDFGLYGAAAADNLAEIEGLAAAGVVGYKTFRTPKPVGREREFIGLCAPDAADYSAALVEVARTGLIGAVHAEDAQLLAANQQALQAAGDRAPMSHARWRPEVVELASVAQSIELALAAGARLQLAHCSNPTAVALAAAARVRGSVTVETCPHYLFLTEADIERHGPFAKINPALRSTASVEGMWAAIAAGQVDVIGSDHSPFLVEEKAPFADDMWGALPGAPGLESLVPLMLTAVADGRISIEQAAGLTSGNAARIYGLRDKGRIAIGADGDLTIVDLAHEGRIDTSAWLTRSRGTAGVWNGRRVRAQVRATVVRGRTVYRDGNLVGAPGWGRLVRPAA